jgi:hypothetical protein
MGGERQRLPDRRGGEVLEVYAGTAEIGISKWIVTVGRRGRLGLGEVAEVFIASGKSGTDVNIMALELGILASLCLQHGVTAETIRHAMPRDDQGRPQGVIGELFDELQRGERRNFKGVEQTA